MVRKMTFLLCHHHMILQLQKHTNTSSTLHLTTSTPRLHRLPSALLDDLWAFNLERHTWIQLQPSGSAPAARQGHSLLMRGTVLFVAGGEYYTGSKWVQAADAYMLDLSLGDAMSWRSLDPTDQVTARPIYSTNNADRRKHAISRLASMPAIQKIAFMHPKDLEFIPLPDTTCIPSSDSIPLASYIAAAFDGDVILFPRPLDGAPPFAVVDAVKVTSSVSIQGAASQPSSPSDPHSRKQLQAPSPSPSSSSRVIINCDGAATAFIITAGGALLANLEIWGCSASAVIVSRDPTDTSTAPVSVINCFFHSNTGFTGPAIKVIGSSYLSITNSHFANNAAYGSSGGAIALETYSTLTAITGTTFRNNTANTTGGAVHASKFSCIGAISDTTFSGNTAGSSGGAIYSTSPSCSLSITTTLFENNVAEDGGAISLVNLAGNAATLANVTLTSNFANLTGGALFISSAYTSVNLDTITASGNRAGLQGGAVMLSSVASLVVASSVFSYNDGGQQGGAIAQYKAGAINSSGNSFTSNSAVYGGAICLGFDSTLALAADIFSSNMALQHGGAVECVSCDSVLALDTVFEGNLADAAGAVALITPKSASVMQVGNSSLAHHTCTLPNCAMLPRFPICVHD
jgi:predicted outer membrane repeat protein